jgi:hypothetical protein
MQLTATTEPIAPSGVFGAVVRRLVRFVGPVAKPVSGRRFFRLWALIHHTGRVSGRSFQTPIVVIRTPSGFIVPLPFGSAQWPRNVVAAGAATLRWNGQDWHVREPVIVGPEGASAFNRVERLGIRAFGISHFLRLTALDGPQP